MLPRARVTRPQPCGGSHPSYPRCPFTGALTKGVHDGRTWGIPAGPEQRLDRLDGGPPVSSNVCLHKAMTLLGDFCCYPSHIPSGSMTIPAETLERYNVPYRNS